MQETVNKKRNIIVIAVIAAVIISSFVAMLVIRKTSGPRLDVVVQYGDQEILRVPLSKDAMYKIEDGRAIEVPKDTTLASLGEEKTLWVQGAGSLMAQFSIHISIR